MKKCNAILLLSQVVVSSVYGDIDTQLPDITHVNNAHTSSGSTTRTSVSNKFYSVQEILRQSPVPMESWVKDEKYLVEDSIVSLRSGLDHANFAAACEIVNSALQTKDFTATALVSPIDLKAYDVPAMLKMTDGVIEDEIKALSALQNVNTNFDAQVVTKQIIVLGKLQDALAKEKTTIIDLGKDAKNQPSVWSVKSLTRNAGPLAVAGAVGVAVGGTAAWLCTKAATVVNT